MRSRSMRSIRSVMAGLLVGMGLVGTAAAQNILKNGGFETGLMCFMNNVWSNTGNFGPGDYKFTLSGDSHSGKYAIEIGCVLPAVGAGDCVKGSIFSNRIPTAPNQDYTLSLWSKCPAREGAAVWVPGMATGDVFVTVTCNGDWAFNTIHLRTSATAQEFYFALYGYGIDFNGVGWVRFDDLTLTYGTSSPGTAGSGVLAHAGNRFVGTSSVTNSVMVDGAPYLALGFFSIPYADLPQAAALGANTVFGLGFYAHASCFATTQKDYLDVAYELGMNFVPDSSTTLRLGVPAVFPSVMQQFAPHLANIAWMAADEPDQVAVPFWYTPPANFIAHYNAAKTQTTLPMFGVFQRAAWSSPNEVAPYAPGVDLFVAEPYGAGFGGVSYAVNMFKNIPPAKPIWLALDDAGANLILPKAYYALANGVTGFAYFSWDGFKEDPPAQAAVSQLFSEMNQLKPVIFATPLANPVAPGTNVNAIARSLRGQTYVLAANPDTTTTTATFNVVGLTAGQQVQVLFENRSVTATTGAFTDTFVGATRHLYVIGSVRRRIPVRTRFNFGTQP